MAGIVFPSIANALVPLMQMDQQKEQNALARQDRADNMAFRKEEADYRHKHLDEQRAARIQTQLAGMAKDKREMVQAFATFQAQYGEAVLNMPPEQQAQGWAMLQEEAKRRSYDPSLFAGQWSPETAARLKFATDAAKGFADGAALPALGGGAQSPGAPATVAPDATKAGGQISSRLTGTHGFSPVAAAGVTGGLYQESGFDPGYGFTRPGGDNGTAHGIAQWRLDRAEGLKKFAAANGKPPTDLDTQVDYLVSEMKGGDQGAQRAYAILQQAKTPEEATTAMMHFFRPAGYTPNNPQGGHGYQQRVQYAQRFGTPADVGAVAGNPAPMPNVSPQQVGAVPGTPAEMPNGPQFAQSGGPPMPPNANGQGGGEGSNVITPPAAAPAAPPQVPHFDVRTKLHEMIPGARLHVDKTGMPLTNAQGLTKVTLPGGQIGFVAIPLPEKPQPIPFGWEKTPDGRIVGSTGGPHDPAKDQDKIARDASKQNTEQANKLRDDFRMEPVVKAYRVVVPMLESAKDAAGRTNSRAADLNLVYAFAKLMDPDSVVRESETGMVQATGTINDRVMGLVGQLNGASTLQPETRAKLIKELQSRFNSLESSYKEIEGAYGEIADSNGIKRSHVILPIRKPKTEESPAPGGVPSISEIDAELQRRAMEKKK